MNDKIKALMAMAMVKSSDMSRPGRKELDPEKFAELIVRECSRVVFDKTGPKSALNVLEHFGVEE
jgi:hypothetical protein